MTIFQIAQLNKEVDALRNKLVRITKLRKLALLIVKMENVFGMIISINAFLINAWIFVGMVLFPVKKKSVMMVIIYPTMVVTNAKFNVHKDVIFVMVENVKIVKRKGGY